MARFTATPGDDLQRDDAKMTLRGSADDALCDGAKAGRALGAFDLFSKRTDLSALTSPDSPLAELLMSAAPRRPRRVVILVHGYEFEPRLGRRKDLPTQPNPHNAIFHDREPENQRSEHISHETPWIARLDPGGGDLIIPFAFSSDPGALSHRFCGESLLKKAGGGLARLFGSRKLGGRRENLFAYGYAMAGEAGLALAAVIAQVARLWGAEGLSIDIIAHSLGARVVTSALRRLAREHETERGITYVDQVIFLAAALSRHQVSALGRETWLLSKGGRRAPTFQIFNFTSQSDKLLRFVGAPLADRVGQRLERGLLPPSSALRLVLMNLPRVKVPVVGVHGGGTASDWLNWIDIP
ncbi:MAG: alpha/beta hydrolase, partial [Pseudomonadota bacterium]